MSNDVPRPDIILARHAHSEGNAGNRTSGFAEISLTPNGHRQAQTLAREIIERFGADNIARIITTPYLRTQQTARPLVERTGLEPLTMPNMREITYLQPAKADGTTYGERTELRNAFWAAARLDPGYVDEGEYGVDSAQSFVGRVHDSLGELASSVSEIPGLQVVYAHEFPISTVLNIANGKSDEDIIASMVKYQKAVPAIENTQAVGLTLRNGEWVLAHDSHIDLFQASREEPE